MSPDPACFLPRATLGPLLVARLRFVQRRTAVKLFGSGAWTLGARLQARKLLTLVQTKPPHRHRE